ncbi:hypothetical protein JCM9534A_13700 [Catenuloplanes indicus JCM 9534]
MVLLFTFLAVPIPVAAASSARAPINLNVRNTGGYIVDICIRSKNDPVQTEDRFCVWNLTVNETEDMPLDDEGVGVLLDFWVDLGPSYEGYDVTGRDWCHWSGLVQNVKMQCESVPRPPATHSAPSIAPFDPSAVRDADDRRVDVSLLNLLAWSVSASGVVGILIVGLNMTLQMRRGDMGFGPDQWRQLTIVGISCIIAVAVAPILTFLDIKLP